jgi:3-dehydroquinate synthase II/3-amino-4-hydroxybenzoic acid synthase
MRAIWCDVSGLCDERLPDVVASIRNSVVSGLIIDSSQWGALMNLPERIEVGCLARDGLETSSTGTTSFLVAPHLEGARRLRAAGNRVALRVSIIDEVTMEAARRAIADVDVLLVAVANETNIPLELLLADAAFRSVEVVKEVDDLDDALASLGVLERGVHAVLFPPTGLIDIARLGSRLAAAQHVELSLRELEVRSNEHVGMGHRGCIDTVSLMAKNEGMLVGSTSWGGALVCAEVHPLPYMNVRPFRVNAGGVHSYVWVPDGKTEYVTDIAAGGRVLVVDTSGRARPVVVGRVKVEVRPLRLIRAKAGDVDLNVFLQDDWHVRVFDAVGKPINITSIAPGDRLLGYTCEPGRHVGIKVDETIAEW